jgi:serine/threonine protein phosphatase PrpC
MSEDVILHKTSLENRPHRPSNEDVEGFHFNMKPNGQRMDIRYPPIDFFVICDGHGGKEVAEFVAFELEKHFMQKNLNYPLTKNYIYKIYERIQQKLIEHPKKIAQNCGCTALVLIRYLDKYRMKRIQVINLGDCRAVLSDNGLALPLCKDHKPFWPDEKKRIDNVNMEYRRNERIHYDSGDWRIGDLSVSRAFGDLDNVPYVTHIPEVYDYAVLDGTEFIIMACDGVWDVLQNHEAVNFVRDHIYDNHTELYNIKNKYPPKEIIHPNNWARRLAEYAIARGSTDNVSVFVIVKKNMTDNYDICDV